MMLQIRNPATCSSPTQNSVKPLAAQRQQRLPRASRAGAISSRLPSSRSSTNSSGGTWPSASFISGQLPAQVSTMIAEIDKAHRMQCCGLPRREGNPAFLPSRTTS